MTFYVIHDQNTDGMNDQKVTHFRYSEIPKFNVTY